MQGDTIPLITAVRMFRLQERSLRNAIKLGIIHNKQPTEKCPRFHLDTNEIEKNIELIKKCDPHYLRLLNRGHRIEDEESILRVSQILQRQHACIME